MGSRIRCRENMVYIRQSRPDSGLDFQVKVLKTFSVVSSSIGIGGPYQELTFGVSVRDLVKGANDLNALIHLRSRAVTWPWRLPPPIRFSPQSRIKSPFLGPGSAL